MDFDFHFWLNNFTLLLLVVLAFAIVWTTNTLTAAILLSVFSLIMALQYLILGAPDVAITEAAVGAGISTLLLLWSLSLVGNSKESKASTGFRYLSLKGVAILASSALFIGLVYATKDLPSFAATEAPYQELRNYYIQQTPHEIGIHNVVTAILASYRGYDTFGEVTVIFTAAMAVILLFGREKSQRNLPSTHTSLFLQLDYVPIVSKVVIQFLAPFILIYAVYLQCYGKETPGGGFQAGIVAASVYIGYGLVFGFRKFKELVSWGVIKSTCALGVFLYGLVGIITLGLGGRFLDYNVLASSAHLGQKLGIFTVELGIGITVFGSMLVFYYMFLTRLIKQ
jgi:multicomponent Na+:H+ antiporter subunit B